MPQRRENNPSVSIKVANKISKLVARGYITEVVILALTSFFTVPKVTDGIRMVFDATEIGINNSLWDPNFMLLSMFIFLMMVGLYRYMIDLDVGEMFYNFQLSLILANYCRLGSGYYMGHKKDRQGTPLWIFWVRLMMVMVLSPYASMQGLLWASEVVRGDRSDPDNPFRWDEIRLNLPRDPSYSPTIP